MAEVWRARGARGTVALKRLLPHAARNRSIVAAFEREGRLLSRISHRNIVGLDALGHDEEGPFLALEYVDGPALRALCTGSQLPVRIALRVARDLLSALEAVHALRDERGEPLGLVHRDLSPSNVLVSKNGSIKLADFGIARGLLGSHRTTGHAIKGTLSYLSPEQATAAPVDQRSDLFGVGAILYEMLSGRPPYGDDDPRLVLARARAGDVAPIGAVRGDLDAALVDLLDRALASVPSDRFPHARAMRDEVERVASSTSGLASDEEIGAWAATAPAETLDPEDVAHAADSVTRAAAARPGAARPSAVGRMAIGAALLLGVGVVAFFVVRKPGRVGAAPPAIPSVVAEPRPVEVAPVLDTPAALDVVRAESSAEVLPPTHTPSVPLRARAESSARSEAQGLLDVGSDPSFGYVTIDGTRVGPTPIYGHPITPGTHRLVVSRDGLGSKSLSIVVRPGEHISRIVKLP
jgi:serine/threonine-protein kinase